MDCACCTGSCGGLRFDFLFHQKDYIIGGSEGVASGKKRTWLSQNPFHVTLPKEHRDDVKERFSATEASRREAAGCFAPKGLSMTLSGLSKDNEKTLKKNRGHRIGTGRREHFYSEIRRSHFVGKSYRKFSESDKTGIEIGFETLYSIPNRKKYILHREADRLDFLKSQPGNFQKDAK
jgi:hypothetical protein